MTDQMLTVYASYAQAKKAIASIEPIDYFFAQDLVQVFSAQASTHISAHLCSQINEQQATELFHLCMALSESLRTGHVCLPIHVLANTNYGYLSDDFGLVLHHGYQFSTVDVLDNLLNTIAISSDAAKPIIYHNNKLYMRRYFEFEETLFNAIAVKSSVCGNRYTEDDIKQCIETFFPDTNDTADTKNTVVEPAQHLISKTTQLPEIDWQKVAVANALNKSFSVIAGGPGTGKTYTVTKLLAALVYLQQLTKSTAPEPLKMALVAPTGKAAQRLSESIVKAVSGFRGVISDNVLDQIPHDTYTIHRLLGVIPNSPNFRFNANNLLNIDVLLIDEVSMVDLAMMNRIFRAIPAHCKVILLGDADQLPSVSAGNVLNDIAPRPFVGYSADNAKYLTYVAGVKIPKISKAAEKKYSLNNSSTKALVANDKEQATELSEASSNEIAVFNRYDNVTFLTKSRRFDGEGGIGQLAQAVITGNAEHSWQLLNQAEGDNQITHLQGELIDWLWPLVKKYYLPIFACNKVDTAFVLLSKFRVLCATRVGAQGVEYLNEFITSLLISKGVIDSGQTLYHGRPIMVSENNYHQGLYNGDIGFLWKNESGRLMAVFEDVNNRYKWVMTSKLPHYETVYAMTIHKTQGSEFSHVAMILSNQKENRLLSRELLYTGITRAKTQISIATNARAWRHGVNTKIVRYSSYTE